MQKRITYFDVLRGIAIIAVVIQHSINEGFAFPLSSFKFNFCLLLRQLNNFCVPLFITISGYFLIKKEINGFSEYTVYLKKQLSKVYIPCMFWSLICLLIAVVLSGKPLQPEFFKLITFQSVAPYYFIALIIQYYILLPVLKKFANPKGVVISAIVSLLLTILISYIRNFKAIEIPLIILGSLFPIYSIFFVYGLYLGAGGNVFIKNKWLIVGIVASYILTCLESYFVIFEFGQIANAITFVKPTAFIYSLFIISFLFKNIDFIKLGFLKYIGEMSFGIYLIHMLVLRLVTKSLKTVFFTFSFYPLYQFEAVFFTIIVCTIIIVTTKKILNKKTIGIIGF